MWYHSLPQLSLRAVILLRNSSFQLRGKKIQGEPTPHGLHSRSRLRILRLYHHRLQSAINELLLIFGNENPAASSLPSLDLSFHVLSSSSPWVSPSNIPKCAPGPDHRCTCKQPSTIKTCVASMSDLFELRQVRRVSSTRGSEYCVEDGNLRSPTPPPTPKKQRTLRDVSNFSIAANGSVPQAPRQSPAPQSGPPVPNGKPTSPYNDRIAPMSPTQQIASQTVSSKDPKAAAQAASDMRNVVRRKLTGYVGFANLPNQWHRKSVRKGFNFNVMVVGECLPSDPELTETDHLRGIRSGKIHLGQHPLQYLPLPAKRAKRS